VVGNIYLGLLNILVASILYKNQHQNLSLRKKSTKSENKSENKTQQKEKCDEKKSCCCQDEIADLLEHLSKKGCEIKILLTTGTACCKIKGLIKDIRQKGSLLLLISPETNAQWYIPIDKIAAIYILCPCNKG
jgi:hypothetical protein